MQILHSDISPEDFCKTGVKGKWIRLIEALEASERRSLFLICDSKVEAVSAASSIRNAAEKMGKKDCFEIHTRGEQTCISKVVE